MARIAGVDLPRNKRIEIALTYIYGIGRHAAQVVLDKAGISPDILCLAKGLTGGSLPLAATLAAPAVYDAHFSEDRARTLFHSSSFTANAICCAAALANVRICRRE